MFILNFRVSHSLLPITQRHQTYVLPGPINGVQFVPSYYHQPFGFYGNGFASYPLGYPFFNGYSSYANMPYYLGAPGNISDYINYETNMLLRNVLNPSLYSNPPTNIMDRTNYQVDQYLMSQGIPPLLGTSSPQGKTFNFHSYNYPYGNIMDRINYQVDNYLMSQGVPPLLGTASIHPEVFNMGTNRAAFNILKSPANTHQYIYYPTFMVSA